MRSRLVLHEGLQVAIKAEVAARTMTHQASMARLRSAKTLAVAAGAPAAAEPLVLLAHGDSWFDYPLSGNVWLDGSTDIIAQLQHLGNITPQILNVSHYGDATTEEMSLPKQERLIQALQDSNNWPSTGKPDAILFSGGGDDIAGNQFCIFLDQNLGAGGGLNATRYSDALDGIEASYLALFAFRDQYARGVPIFGHDYDFPVPNGSHPLCAGPWLQPSLQYRGWNALADGTRIVHDALLGFKARLAALAADAANNFTLIDTQGTLQPADWANELHPMPDGFKAIAEKFVGALSRRFPGNI